VTTAVEVVPIPYDQVVQEIEEIIAEKPEGYHYQRPENGSCAYVHYDRGRASAGCIVGVWLHRFQHIPLATLHTWEGSGADSLVARLYQRRILVRPLDRRAAKFLDILQERQDTGKPWRMSADMAQSWVRERWDQYGPEPRLLSDEDTELV
jgi:hypothetical protein